MTIETKANIGDTIYFMEDNKVQSSKVYFIAIDVSKKKDEWTKTECSSVKISYTTEQRTIIQEELAFTSKEDLLKSL